MKKHYELMQEAKALIDTPEKWTRFVLAQTKYNTVVLPQNPDACKFCSMGALDRAYGGASSSGYVAQAYLHAAMGGSVGNFNDTHTHEEVMQAWDAAIAKAKKEDV